DEHAAAEARMPDRVEEMSRGQDIPGERCRAVVPRLGDLWRTGKMKDRRRTKAGDLTLNVLAVEQIDRGPFREAGKLRPRSRAAPSCNAPRAGQQLDEMAAREAGRTGDQDWAGQGHLPLFVLSLVVRLERGIALLDRTPPPFVLSIPRDRVLQPGLEWHLGCPADAAQFRRIETIAPVVPRPIGDRLDQRSWFAEPFEDAVGEVDVHDIVAAADVVDLSVGGAIDEQIDRATVVEHVQPVANVLPVAVEPHPDEIGSTEIW